MTDTKNIKPSTVSTFDNPDIVQNVATFLGTAAIIGTLTTCSGEPQEHKATDNKEEPTASHTTDILKNSGAALGGGLFAAAALERLRKREERLKQKQTDRGRSV